ncbi:MAG: DUF4376 domain-containing protein, partial [Labrys sp. (in: a-proteobacteria)]
VRDDKVVNILPEAPPEGWSLPDHTVIDAEAQIGWIWNGSAWVDPTPPINLSAIAAEARYLAETSGIALNGATILTDRESQALINGAVSLCQINPAATVKFKTVSGAFVTLDATQVIGIGVAVGTHVQACFAREADVASEIAAGTLTTEAAVRARFNDLVMP